MSTKKTLLFSLVIVLLIIAAMVGPIMSNVEHPKYQTLSSNNNISLRHYAPVIIAEVSVEGERKQAIRDGFRILADYIFGENTSSEKVAMTAPVQQTQSQKIAMTAPVQQQGKNNLWTISFVMPSEYTLAKLPKPNDSRVILKEIPQKTVAVIEFSGLNSNENLEKHEKILMNYIASEELKTIGDPVYAFYNPPWTLPFLRRNEVMITIADTSIRKEH